MSLTVIKNQALVFDTQDACNECFNSDYCTPIQAGDTTKIQVRLSPITGVDLSQSFDSLTNSTTTGTTGFKCVDAGATFLTDGVIVGAIIKNTTDTTYALVTAVDSETQLTLDTDIFTSGENYYILNWEGLAGTPGTAYTWNHTDGTVTFISNNAELSLDQRLYSGKYYKIRFSSTGNNTGAGNIKVWSGTGSYASLGVRETNVDAVAYFIADGIDFRLKFVVTTGAPQVTISSIELFEVSVPGFKVQDCDSGFVYYDSADNSQTGISLVEQEYGTDIDTWGQIDIDWASIVGDVPVNACYCVCIYDYGLLNYNWIDYGRFSGNVYSNTTHLKGWTITNVNSAGFALSGSSVLHTAEVGASQDTLLQILTTALDSTKDYTITADIGYTGAGFDLYVRANPGAVTLDTINITADETISVPVTGLALTQLYFNSDENHTWSIDNISITLDEVPCTTSNCLTLREDVSNLHLDSCDYLVTGTCDTNAFGFNFEDLTFTLQLRVFGKIRNARYANEEETYRYDTGVSSLIYANTRKIKEFQVREIPEAVHDTLRIILLTDTLQIDAVDYIKVEGEYAPNWRKSSVKAPVIVEIAEKTQDTTNTYC